jgi:hypothetical protein
MVYDVDFDKRLITLGDYFEENILIQNDPTLIF